MSVGEKVFAQWGAGRAGWCVLISLHELGMVTRDLRDQVRWWLSQEVVAAQPSGKFRG